MANRVLTHDMRNGLQYQGLVDLCNYVKQNSKRDILKIVEIGSYCGAGSKIIAEFFPGSTLFCVDPWEKYIEECSLGNYDLDKQELELREAEEIFDSILINTKNIIKNKTSSVAYANLLEDNSIDMVYIDGNHQYSSVKEDLEIWYPKIKNNGIIAGHDLCWESVKSALMDYFKKSPDHSFVDSSWLYFKN